MEAAATLEEAALPGEQAERRFVLFGVPWTTYVALRDAMDGHGGSVKMTYLKGALELMRPSMLHEDAKKIIARLSEVWAMERDVDLRGFGGATFRREAKDRGLEPDECYKLGKLDDDGAPDIAIEVIVTSALVDKMAVYAGLGVRRYGFGGLWRGDGPPTRGWRARAERAKRSSSGSRHRRALEVRTPGRGPDPARQGVPNDASRNVVSPARTNGLAAPEHP